MPVISATRRQRQDCCKLEATLILPNNSVLHSETFNWSAEVQVCVTHPSGSRGQPGLPENLCQKAKGLETSKCRKLPLFNSVTGFCVCFPIPSLVG